MTLPGWGRNVLLLAIIPVPHADKKRHATSSDIQVGDSVLLQQRRDTELVLRMYLTLLLTGKGVR